MLKLKKYQNNELGIYDEAAKKFVPLRGKNLKSSIGHLRGDIRDYFETLDRKELLVAAKIVFKAEGE